MKILIKIFLNQNLHPISSNYTACCLNLAKIHTKKSSLSGQKTKPNSDYRELINPTWINSLATKPTGICQVPIQHELAPVSSLELIPKTNCPWIDSKKSIAQLGELLPFYSLRRPPDSGGKLRGSGEKLRVSSEYRRKAPEKDSGPSEEDSESSPGLQRKAPASERLPKRN